MFPRLDPLRVLTTSAAVVTPQRALDDTQILILASEETWQSVGEAIHNLRKLEDEEVGVRAGTRYCISLPGDESQAAGRKLVAADALSKSRLSLSPTTPVSRPSFDQILGKDQQSKSPTMQKLSTRSLLFRFSWSHVSSIRGSGLTPALHACLVCGPLMSLSADTVGIHSLSVRVSPHRYERRGCFEFDLDSSSTLRRSHSGYLGPLWLLVAVNASMPAVPTSRGLTGRDSTP